MFQHKVGYKREDVFLHPQPAHAWKWADTIDSSSWSVSCFFYSSNSGRGGRREDASYTSCIQVGTGAAVDGKALLAGVHTCPVCVTLSLLNKSFCERRQYARTGMRKSLF